MAETIEMAKVRLQVTVREDIVKWIDQEIEKLRFANRSHAIEYALLQLMEKKAQGMSKSEAKPDKADLERFEKALRAIDEFQKRQKRNEKKE